MVSTPTGGSNRSAQVSAQGADDIDIVRIASFVTALVFVVVACGNGTSAAPPTSDAPNSPELPDASATGAWNPVTYTAGGLTGFARSEGDRLVISTGAGPREFVAGVNLGPTIPGRQPGEQAIGREDFRRWFPQMRDLGFRALRVYTIMPPAFYQELEAFNLANPDYPLLLLHGAWIPEERFYETYDLFDAEIISEFKAEIGNAVGAVHGDVVLPDRLGHAGGTYDADVSPWLMSWAIGVELDPFATSASDIANAGLAPYRGDYFENTSDASPTEVWLAEMLDHLAGLEAERRVTMPLTFVNWPTTDPLIHPDEPLEYEDLLGVDHNHIQPKSSWPGGYYASYHAYPYYPDFQRYEEGIAGFTLDGAPDNYAGYLTKLRDHHAGMPVMITEFGVPSAMAHAHFGPQERNQGAHNEPDQMAINADLLETIEAVDLAGGFVFQWVDEWFKFTWNTIDYELPSDRRSLWVNRWTNEANFGVVAADPGLSQLVVLDGDDSEWPDSGSQVILESAGAVSEVRALKDEGYLYLRIRLAETEQWLNTPIAIGFDILAGGSGGLPGTGGAAPKSDYAVVFHGNEGRMLVRASNDPYGIQYAWQRGYEPVNPADFAEGSGVWNVQRLIVNHPLVIPTTGEALGAEVISPGEMIHGTTNVDHPEFDSRSTWSARDKVIELRLPHQAIGFSDPSSLQAYRISPNGTLSTETVARVGLAVVVGDELFETSGYAWEPWQAPEWHERLKAGADVLAEAVIAANTP